MMRFYNFQHRYYCGVDLHTKRMYLCILDQEGNKLLHRNVRAKPREFLSAIERFRDDLVVGAECMFTWYWLADLCLAWDCYCGRPDRTVGADGLFWQFERTDGSGRCRPIMCGGGCGV
jgi:hypothetical protein